MRTYGKLVTKVGGHTENSPALVNRMAEVYVTKTKVKSYLFDSSFMYWHKKNHLIDMVESKLDRPIEDITAEHINKFATENNIKFNK